MRVCVSRAHMCAHVCARQSVRVRFLICFHVSLLSHVRACCSRSLSSLLSHHYFSVPPHVLPPTLHRLGEVLIVPKQKRQVRERECVRARTCVRARAREDVCVRARMCVCVRERERARAHDSHQRRERSREIHTYTTASHLNPTL